MLYTTHSTFFTLLILLSWFGRAAPMIIYHSLFRPSLGPARLVLTTASYDFIGSTNLTSPKESQPGSNWTRVLATFPCSWLFHIRSNGTPRISTRRWTQNGSKLPFGPCSTSSVVSPQTSCRWPVQFTCKTSKGRTGGLLKTSFGQNGGMASEFGSGSDEGLRSHIRSQDSLISNQLVSSSLFMISELQCVLCSSVLWSSITTCLSICSSQHAWFWPLIRETLSRLKPIVCSSWRSNLYCDVFHSDLFADTYFLSVA